MKRIGRILALLFCLSLSACSLMPEEEVYRSAPVTKDYEAAPYQFAAVVRGDMELTEKISLNYVPVQTEKLAFTVDGEYYDGVFVALGDSVKAGQLLAQLRVDDLLAARDACDRQIELLELSIRQLEERRALNLERVRLNADPADRSALEKALRQTNENTDAERAALEDQLTVQQAYRGEYDRRIEARRLRASFDGTVTYARKIDEGARSRLNERVVVVADSTLSLFRGETEWWSYFHEGDEYVITSNNREYHAVVTGEETLGLSPTEHVEGEKGYVYLALTEPAFDLDDGSRGTLILTRDSRTNVLMIPEDAVTLANGEPIVYYQNEEGVKAYKSIVIGLAAGDRVEVVDGLSEGDSVIVG